MNRTKRGGDISIDKILHVYKVHTTSTKGIYMYSIVAIVYRRGDSRANIQQQHSGEIRCVCVCCRAYTHTHTAAARGTHFIDRFFLSLLLLLGTNKLVAQSSHSSPLYTQHTQWPLALSLCVSFNTGEMRFYKQ